MTSPLSAGASLVGPLLLVLSLGTIVFACLRRRNTQGQVSLRDVRRETRARRAEQRELHELVTSLARQVEDLATRLEGNAGLLPARSSEVAGGATSRVAGRVTSRVARRVARTSGTPLVRVPSVHVDPRFAAVYELADGGESSIAISQSVQMPLGEIEVILNLRNFAA